MPSSEITIEVLKVSINALTSKMFWYHFSEKPSGGNFRTVPGSKEVMEMMTSGPSKNIKTSSVYSDSMRFPSFMFSPLRI
ncbi:hypothetical protein D3C81_1825280 [compost metagenome]